MFKIKCDYGFLLMGKIEKIKQLFFKSEFSFEIILISLFINVLSLALPFALLQIYDRIMPNQSYETATVLLIGVVLAIFFESVLRYFRNWMLALSSANFEFEAMDSSIKSLFNSNYDDLAKLGPGRIFNGLKAISHIRDTYSGYALLSIIDLPFAVIFLSLVAYIGNELVIIPCLIWVFVFVSVYFFSQNLILASEKMTVTESYNSRVFIDIFSKLNTYKSIGNEVDLSNEFISLNQSKFECQKKVDDLSSKLQEYVGSAAQITTIALVSIGAIYVLDGEMTTGGLTACSILSGRAVAPLSALVGLYTKIANTKVAKNEVDSLQGISNENEIYKKTSSGNIYFDNVMIEKLNTNLKFNNIKIESGSTVEISSEIIMLSNSFLRLIGSVDKPDNGSVLIDDVSLNFIEEERSLKKSIVIVPAWPTLFTGTIMDNMTMFNPNLEDVALEISNELGLNSYFNQLPSGYHTIIDESGVEILGKGYTKLIALVRAFVQKPSIVLLEQPFVSLDISSSKLLIKLFNKLKGQQTLLLTSNEQINKGIMKDMDIIIKGDGSYKTIHYGDKNE